VPRILGLDYGERRLGFALSDPDGIISMPHSVSHIRDRREALGEVERVAKATAAARLVIGLPLNMNGTAGFQADNVTSFAEELRARLSIPVETWDERLSTRSAEHVLIEAGESRRRRKEVVDKLAAQIMLQNYLDAHTGGLP